MYRSVRGDTMVSTPDWLLWALSSAVSAALTSILAKVVKGVWIS